LTINRSDHGTKAANPSRDFVTMNQEDPRKWILIVDDDASVRLMLARVLTGEGYGVLTAADGPHALELADIARVDLVLLDINMPGENGWEMLKKMQAKKLPCAVLIITALPNQESPARQAGVETVLEKPLHFPTLISRIAEILAKQIA
jgi:CheY-like chemotaxis protein